MVFFTVFAASNIANNDLFIVFLSAFLSVLFSLLYKMFLDVLCAAQSVLFVYSLQVQKLVN